jgi:hypothetical protein
LWSACSGILSLFRLSKSHPSFQGERIMLAMVQKRCVRWVEVVVETHCFSRNFRNNTKNGHFTGHLIRPDLITKTMVEEDLLLFTLKLESGPHNTIPFGIRGDFLSFNTPAGMCFIFIVVVQF